MLRNNKSTFLESLEKDLITEYQHILPLEEELWALKSCINWTLLGDRNTNFFHLTTICQRQYNKIWCLKDSVRNWTQSPLEIKAIISTHFTTLYTSDTNIVPLLLPSLDNFTSFEANDHDVLNAMMTNLDIKNAILSFKPYKAPCPDGFQSISFQRFWNIVGPSVIPYVKEIFQSKKIPKSLNSTPICLIPKMDKRETVHQFRLIRLCNTLYKTITKLPVRRLKLFLPNLIHPYQGS